MLTFKDGGLEKAAEANAKRRASFHRLALLANKYDWEDKKVLDIGIHGDVWPGGHGFFFNNATYETLDIDPYVQPTHVADVRELPFEDNSYDLIICHSVIEHVLENREKAYAEIYRVLNKGGTAVYVIPTVIDEREVEPAKHVSRTRLLAEHDGKRFRLVDLPDKTMYMEVYK